MGEGSRVDSWRGFAAGCARRAVLSCGKDVAKVDGLGQARSNCAQLLCIKAAFLCGSNTRQDTHLEDMPLLFPLQTILSAQTQNRCALTALTAQELDQGLLPLKVLITTLETRLGDAMVAASSCSAFLARSSARCSALSAARARFSSSCCAL